MHMMRSQSHPGMGRWKECSVCGASQHSGLWWLGGYKSKAEPPCGDGKMPSEWVADAERLTEEDMQ